MGISFQTLNNDVQAMIRGQMLGNVFYVNGDNGDDHSNGDNWNEALRTPAQGITRLIDENHDYLLMAGANTPGAAIEIAVADAHIIGIGSGSPAVRGFTLTCPAADCLQPTAAADNLEIANIDFVTQGQVVVDDAGCLGFYMHDCTFKPTAETDNTAITLDLEGASPAVVDCDFLWQALAIDSVGLRTIVKGCLFVTDTTTSTAINISNTTAHTFQILGCTFQMTGTTNDEGIIIISGADDGIIKDCWFNKDVNDSISDSGTNTLIINCFDDAITGTSTSSLWLAVQT